MRYLRTPPKLAVPNTDLITNLNADFLDSISSEGFLQTSGDQTATGIKTFTDNTGSSSTTTGTLVVTGGVGISENVYVGGIVEASSIAATSVRSLDTRNTTPIPSLSKLGVEFDLKSNAVNGINDGGFLNGTLTFRPFGSGADFSGGPVHQLTFTASGNIYHRLSQTDSLWTDWNRLIKLYDTSSNNVSSTVVIRDGLGNFSASKITSAIQTPNGTDGIFIGDDAVLADRNVSNTVFVSGQQNTDRGYINFGTIGGNSLGAINGGALTWNENTVWHSGNDGAGSGLDADLLDGKSSTYFYSADNPPLTTNTLSLTSNTPSTSTTTGTLVVTGGVGISENLYVGGSFSAGTLVYQTTKSTVSGVTAAGTTQATATEVSTDLINVVNVPLNSGIRLPDDAYGRRIAVRNNGLNDLKIYPGTTGQINSVGIDTPYILGIDTTLEFIGFSVDQWYTVNSTFA